MTNKEQATTQMSKNNFMVNAAALSWLWLLVAWVEGGGGTRHCSCPAKAIAKATAATNLN